MKWSTWKPITEEPQWVEEGCQGGGVYQVRATDGNANPLTIRRCCEDDPEGILYVGEGNLGDRVHKVLKWDKSHPMPFNFDYYGLDCICPRDRLQYRWMPLADHKNEEKRLLDEYKQRTGDLPPCNVKT